VKTHSQETLGKFALVGEAFSTSLTGIVIRFLGPSFTILQQVSLRVFSALVLSMIVWGRTFRWQKLKELPRTEWILILVRSLCYYLFGVALYSWSVLQINYTTNSLISRFPFTAILGVVLLKETITKKKITWIVIGILGVLVAVVDSPDKLFHWGSGEILALTSTFFFSLSYVLRKFHKHILTDIEITQLMFFFSLCILTLCSLFFQERLDIATLTTPSVLLVIVAAGVINIAIVGCINYGYKRVDAILANNISLLKLVFAALVSILIFREPSTLQTYIGGSIIILAVFNMNALGATTKKEGIHE